MRIQGISGSRGVAVGNVYRYIQEEIVIPDYNVTEDKVEEEIGKFATAMASTLKQLDTIRKKALDEMGPEEASIFEAHMQIAQDPSLSDGIKSLVESSHMNVVAATAQTIETFANIFNIRTTFTHIWIIHADENSRKGFYRLRRSSYDVHF